MTLQVPLSVRLQTRFRDIHLTDRLSDLSFSASSPGGYDTATMSLHRPISFTPGEILEYARVYIYDARSAITVWEGRLQDPGRSAGSDGPAYALGAIGGKQHFSDTTVPYILLDRRVSVWEKRDNNSNEVRPATVQAGEEIGGTQRDTIYTTFPSGTKLTMDKTVTAVYSEFARAGMELALVDYLRDDGFTSPSFECELMLANNIVYRASTPSTAGEGYSARVVTVNWPTGQTTPMLRLRWNSATPVTLADDIYWSAWVAPIVAAVRYNADGTKKTSGYTSGDETILASTVVADLLGRLLTETINGGTANVQTTTYAIEQIAYPDGVTPAQVLDDMIALELPFTWHVWGSTLADDRFTFEWLPWPNTVRYEADVTDGFEASGNSASLYNSVSVRYKDGRGRINTVTRNAGVQTLTDAGFDRCGFIDLSDEIGSAANATQAGDMWLAEHNQPINAGRLTLQHPILDVQTGQMVDPWEVRPGNLVRVRGVRPYPDSFNVTGRDGATVFRINASSFSTSDASMVLDLDAYAPDVVKALVALHKAQADRRRR